MTTAKHRHILFLSIFIVAISISNIALGQFYDYNQLKFKQYTTADNLASNACSKIYSDSYGFLWVSNYYGVSIFNGHKFVNLPLHQSQPNYSLGDYPHGFLQLNKDSMFISSGNGFYLFNYNNYTVSKVESQVVQRPGTYVRLVGFDSTDKKIFIRVNEDIVVLDRHLLVLKKFLLKDENKNVMLVNKHTFPFHYYYTNSGTIISVNVNTFTTDTVFTEPGNSGFITVNNQLKDIIIFSNKTITRIRKNDKSIIESKKIPYAEDFKNGARNAEMDMQQNLWIAGSKGLFIYHTATNTLNKASVFTTNHGNNSMNEAIINDILQNKNGIFITTINGGLLAYDNQASLFNNYALPGAASNSAFSMIVQENRLLTSTDQEGLLNIPLYHPDKREVKRLISGYNRSITLLESIDPQHVWILSRMNLQLAILNTHTFTIVSKGFPTDAINKQFNEKEFSKERAEVNMIPFIKKVSDDQYYYCINNNLFSITGNITKGFSFTFLDSVPGNTFISAIGYANHQLIVGTGNFNLYALQDHQLKRHFQPASPINIAAKSINIGQNNDIYVLTTNGLYVFDKQYALIHHFTQENAGLQSNILYTGIIDSREILWMSSAAGIIAFDISKQRIYNYSSFNLFNNRDFNSRSITIDSMENIYFGGTGGISTVLAQQAQLNKADGILYFTEIRNNNQLIYKGIAPGSIKADETFEHYQNSFHFTVSTILYNPPGKIQYAYQLKGWDTTWVIGGSNTEISYTNLPSGKYTLTIKELNTNDNTNQISYSFSISQPFWKTGWFIALVILSSAGLIAFFAMFYMQKKLEQHRIHISRQTALKAERERISKELHDDLGTGLTSIKLLSKSLVTKPEQKNLPAKLDCIDKISGELIDQMSEIVWLMNHSDDTLQGMLAHLRLYMAEYLQRIESPVKLRFTNSITEENFQLNGIQKRNLLLVIKESFHNTVKHSKASTYSIHVSTDNTYIHLELADDGVGLPETMNGRGNGMGNMKKRIKDLNGTIQFTGTPGTRITIKLFKEML